jgi:hypothetical protein
MVDIVAAYLNSGSSLPDTQKLYNNCNEKLEYKYIKNIPQYNVYKCPYVYIQESCTHGRKNKLFKV